MNGPGVNVCPGPCRTPSLRPGRRPLLHPHGGRDLRPKYGTALTMDVFTAEEERQRAGRDLRRQRRLVLGARGDRRPASSRRCIERGYTVFAVVHGSQPQVHHPRDPRGHEPGRPVHPATTPRITGSTPTGSASTAASAGGHLSLMQGTAGDAGEPEGQGPGRPRLQPGPGGGLLLPAHRLPQLRQARRERPRPRHPARLPGPVRLPRARPEARRRSSRSTDEAKRSRDRPSDLARSTTSPPTTRRP